MKRTVLIVCLLLPLFACAPTRPARYGAEVPAGPLLHELAERRESLHSLKALASARMFRKNRKISLDQVGVFLRGDGRFRIDAYGPLGQPLMQVAWDGTTTTVLRNGELLSVPGRAALARYLGADVDPGELGALLTGNLLVPEAAGGAEARCDGADCMVELRSSGLERRFWFTVGTEGAAGIRPVSFELSHSGKVLLVARYSGTAPAAGYQLPRTVTIESPGRRSGLSLSYEEQEVNVPIDDAVFLLEGAAQ